MAEIISIIVPVYQAAATVTGCVESILAQSDPDYELLLIDDGSTDGAGEICDRLATRDARIRVLHTENKGAASARNYGLDHALGTLISFIDSDDTVAPDYLSYLRRLREASGARLVVAAHDTPTIGALHQEHKVDRGSTMSYYPGENALRALLYQQPFMSVPWGMLSERTLWEQVRFPEGTEAEDMGTIYRLFLAAGDVAYGDRVVYHYIQRPDSTIYTTGQTRNPAYYKHSRRMIADLRQRCPKALPAAYHRHYSACCQILSESSLRMAESPFLKQVRTDIMILSPRIVRDRDARRQNRGAALIACISPRLLHLMLRVMARLYAFRYRKGVCV